ncbi:sigma-70 family RNA polymerase sigma factor [Bacillus sp. AK031]
MRAKLSNTPQTAEQLMDYYPKLKSYCCKLAGNSWDGDDLAQETVLRVLRTYSKSPSSLSTGLLYTIARNNWIDTVRKNAKETKLMENQLDRCKEQVCSLEVENVIEKLLKNFTMQQTVTFLLKDVFLYSFKEIAEEIASTEGAVKASLFRMRTRLKTGCLEDADGDLSQISRLLTDGLINESPSMMIRLLKETKETTSEPSMEYRTSTLLSSGIQRSFQRSPILAA